MSDGLLGEDPVEVLRVLQQSGALLANDHFAYDSGEHGSGWIDKDAVYLHPERTAFLCEHLAHAAIAHGAEAVCGTAIEGLVIAQWTAPALGSLAVFADHAPERGQGAVELRRGSDRVVPGTRVLVVDDVVN